MPTAEIAELVLSPKPDRMVMHVKGLDPARARKCANMAAAEARRRMPKSTGYAANRLLPIYGPNYFGILWQDSYVWFQEHGISPFTMYSLAGKTIPMWVKDPTGSERLKNPKAKVRLTMSGVVEVLIFRRAAERGQRTTKWRKNRKTHQMEEVDVPASYPGAPGRIGVREMAAPLTTPGRVAGAIARGNGGVRWRHPGLAPRMFLNISMSYAAQVNGILPIRVYVGDQTWKNYVNDYEAER